MIWPNLVTLDLPWTFAVVLFGSLEYLMPEMTRREVLFSVRVPLAVAERMSAAAVRRYRVWLVASTVAALVILGANPGLLSRWTGEVAFCVQYLGFAAALFRARREVWPHAAPTPTRREADLGEFDSSSPGIVAFGIPLVCVSSVAIWTYSNWNTVPDPFPIHWTLGLQPDEWVSRTSLHVYGLLGLLGGTTALLGLLGCGLVLFCRRKGSRRIGGWITSAALILMLCAEYLVAGMSMLPLGLSTRGTDLAVFISIAAASVYLIVFGTGGIPEATCERSAASPDVSPDSAWKLGLFYYNPQDSAVFVEKRFGIGWTINLASPWAWVSVCVVLLPIALGAVFLITLQW